MFSSKKTGQFASGGHTLFDAALEVKGTVTFGGTLDIEGRVVGDIYAAEGADALVRVREKGSVEGEIHAPKVIINGKVVGDIYSSKHLELASNAIVNGNVHYRVIEMVKGAEVNGNLIHEQEPKVTKPFSQPHAGDSAAKAEGRDKPKPYSASAAESGGH